MADWYFHYTSRARLQAIRRAGAIVPGPSGKVWLSPDLYDVGHVVASRLSTPVDTPREVVVALPADQVEALVLTDLDARMVEPIYLDGVPVGGGGREVTVAELISVTPGTLFFILRDP